jgi:hypothetical protein
MGEPRRRVKYSIDPNALNWAQGKNKNSMYFLNLKSKKQILKKMNLNLVNV